jgi:hypothetical protein
MSAIGKRLVDERKEHIGEYLSHLAPAKYASPGSMGSRYAREIRERANSWLEASDTTFGRSLAGEYGVDNVFLGGPFDDVVVIETDTEFDLLTLENMQNEFDKMQAGGYVVTVARLPSPKLESSKSESNKRFRVMVTRDSVYKQFTSPESTTGGQGSTLSRESIVAESGSHLSYPVKSLDSLIDISVIDTLALKLMHISIGK